MRNNILERITFFIAIITACLLFSNCRVLQKSKSEFTEKQTSENQLFEKNSGSTKIVSEFNQEHSSIYDFSNDKFTELFKLNYQPLFDVSGNIIPLIFKHTKNGQTEEFYLSGGSLNQDKSTTSDKIKEVLTNKINIQYKSEITYKSQITYKTHTTYITKIKEKDKDLKSYDFSFFTGLSMILWLILFIVIVLKTSNNWLNKVINKIRNKNPPAF